MDTIDLKYIENIKEEGYRPSVIGALICHELVALFRSNRYPGYEFVQGGINFGELPIEAIQREVIEELGYWFYTECQFPPQKAEFLFEDRMKMNIKEKILTASGKTVNPIGKHYLIYAVSLKSDKKLPEINPDDLNFNGTSVKFDRCSWTTNEKAKQLVQTITNSTKKSIAIRALQILFDKKYIR